LLPVQKIRFTYLQQYNDNRMFTSQESDVTAKKAVGNANYA